MTFLLYNQGMYFSHFVQLNARKRLTKVTNQNLSKLTIFSDLIWFKSKHLNIHFARPAAFPVEEYNFWRNQAESVYST